MRYATVLIAIVALAVGSACSPTHEYPAGKAIALAKRWANSNHINACSSPKHTTWTEVSGEPGAWKVSMKWKEDNFVSVRSWGGGSGTEGSLFSVYEGTGAVVEDRRGSLELTSLRADREYSVSCTGELLGAEVLDDE